MAILNQLKPKNILIDPKYDNQWAAIIQVNINDGNQGRVYEWGGGYAYDADLRLLQPIQLTSELVEKLLPLNGEFPDNDNFYIEKSGHNSNYFDLCFEQQYTGASIQFLHELQNLYFALTGQDLEVEKLSQA